MIPLENLLRRKTFWTYNWRNRRPFTTNHMIVRQKD